MTQVFCILLNELLIGSVFKSEDNYNLLMTEVIVNFCGCCKVLSDGFGNT